MTKMFLVFVLGFFCIFNVCALDVKVSNIAGFATFKYVAGLSQCTPCTAPFTAPDGSDPDINQLFSRANFLGLSEDLMDNTDFMSWNPDIPGYEYFIWCGDGDGTELGFPELDNKWIVWDLVVTNHPVRSGTGFFIVTTREAMGVIDGIVNTNDVVQIEVHAGENLLANPFPAPISIQDIQSSDLVGIDMNNTFRAKLRYWTGIQYDEYGWCAEGQGETLGMPEWNSRWLHIDASAEAVQTIGIGEIFWIVTPVPATLTIAKPQCLFLHPSNDRLSE